MYYLSITSYWMLRSLINTLYLNMKIKICKKYKKLNKLGNKLHQAFPDDTVVIKGCINLCRICKNKPTAQTKSKRFKAADISSLIEKIKAKH